MLKRALIASLGILSVGAEAALAEGYAVIVGVNDSPAFRLPSGARPRALRGAESDAEAFADLLIREYRFAARNVHVLKGPAATRDAVRATLARIGSMAGAEDQFLFYFAGHGTQVPDRRPFDEPDGLDEALCTSDANEKGENLLIDDDLALWLDDIPIRHLTVILDCCHADSGTKEIGDEITPRFLPSQTPPRPTRPKASLWRELGNSSKSIGRRTAAFFACRADQLAYERRIPGRPATSRAGQFSRYLIEGLRDKAADSDGNGVVSNRELHSFASRRLDETFNRDRTESVDRQEPMYEADGPDMAVVSFK